MLNLNWVMPRISKIENPAFAVGFSAFKVRACGSTILGALIAGLSTGKIMAELSPFNLTEWIENNCERLKPPVGYARV